MQRRHIHHSPAGTLFSVLLVSWKADVSDTGPENPARYFLHHRVLPGATVARYGNNGNRPSEPAKVRDREAASDAASS